MRLQQMKPQLELTLRLCCILHAFNLEKPGCFSITGICDYILVVSFHQNYLRYWRKCKLNFNMNCCQYSNHVNTPSNVWYFVATYHSWRGLGIICHSTLRQPLWDSPVTVGMDDTARVGHVMQQSSIWRWLRQIVHPFVESGVGSHFHKRTANIKIIHSFEWARISEENTCTSVWNQAAVQAVVGRTWTQQPKVRSSDKLGRTLPHISYGLSGRKPCAMQLYKRCCDRTSERDSHSGVAVWGRPRHKGSQDKTGETTMAQLTESAKPVDANSSVRVQ